VYVCMKSECGKSVYMCVGGRGGVCVCVCLKSVCVCVCVRVCLKSVCVRFFICEMCVFGPCLC